MRYDDDGLDPLDGDEPINPSAADRIGPMPMERTGPSPLERTRRPSARLGMSVPGAIGGVLLIGAIAFGANLGLVSSQGELDDADPTPKAYTMATDAPDNASADEPEKEQPDRTAKPTEKSEPKPTKDDKVAEATEPTAKPTEKTEPKPTEKTEPKPTAKPTEKPEPKPTTKPVLGIELGLKNNVVIIEWSGCGVDGADYYKVVRSYDDTITWPAGDNDAGIAAVEIGGERRAWDKDAKGGKVAYYRVFCVNATDSGYKVLAASKVASIKVPVKEEPTPKPTPEVYAMWIEAGQTGDAVTISWEACGSDGFSHYRVIRKVDGEANVIAEIENAGTTTFVDDAVEVGATYKYTVQAKGQLDGQWVLLGTTEWALVTVE